jgi:hypothetical protein
MDIEDLKTPYKEVITGPYLKNTPILSEFWAPFKQKLDAWQ